jgi:DNA-binding GntR family transcriptional regulator
VVEKQTDDGENGPGPLTQLAAQTLRKAIFERRLLPGEPVRQEAVAKELGISRIPVREALRQLESEGLVVIRPNSGARVAVLDFEECVEIYKIRERIEPLAISESVGRLTDEQLAEMTTLMESLKGLTGDPEAWLEGDRKLHLACYAGVQTPRLLRMIVTYWNTTQHYRRLLLTTFSPEEFAIADADHLLMVTALKGGHVRAAEELLRVAIERSRFRLSAHQSLFDK